MSDLSSFFVFLIYLSGFLEAGFNRKQGNFQAHASKNNKMLK